MMIQLKYGGLLGALQEARDGCSTRRQREIQRGMTGSDYDCLHQQVAAPINEAQSLTRAIRRKFEDARARNADPDYAKDDVEKILAEILDLIGADHTEVR